MHCPAKSTQQLTNWSVVVKMTNWSLLMAVYTVHDETIHFMWNCGIVAGLACTMCCSVYTCRSKTNSANRLQVFTRKLSYRKDDRAMRPYMGALKIFRSLCVGYVHGYVSRYFNGLLF